MTIQLKGIELKLPEGSTIAISEDGTKVKVSVAPVEIEKIRVIEVPGPVQETIRFVEATTTNWPYKYPYLQNWNQFDGYQHTFGIPVTTVSGGQTVSNTLTIGDPPAWHVS